MVLLVTSWLIGLWNTVKRNSVLLKFGIGSTRSVCNLSKKWLTFLRISLLNWMRISVWTHWNNVSFKNLKMVPLNIFLNCQMVCWLRRFWCVNTMVCLSVWQLRLDVTSVVLSVPVVWLRNNVTWLLVRLWHKSCWYKNTLMTVAMVNVSATWLLWVSVSHLITMTMCFVSCVLLTMTMVLLSERVTLPCQHLVWHQKLRNLPTKVSKLTSPYHFTRLTMTFVQASCVLTAHSHLKNSLKRSSITSRQPTVV